MALKKGMKNRFGIRYWPICQEDRGNNELGANRAYLLMEMPEVIT
jgi:hypothetical protein